jgi:hypothetical protein
MTNEPTEANILGDSLLCLLKDLHMLTAYYEDAVPTEELTECIARAVERLG